jgi:DNA repair protein RadC
MIKITDLERSPRLAELRAVYRRRASRKGPQVKMPADVVAYLRKVWDNDTLDLREDCLLICLNGAHEVLGWIRVASGGMNSAIVDPRLVFGVALQVGANSIIIAHNHPSDRTEPSADDRALTRRLADGAKLLGINFLDHIILGRAGFFSFDDAGLL